MALLLALMAAGASAFALLEYGNPLSDDAPTPATTTPVAPAATAPPPTPPPPTPAPPTTLLPFETNPRGPGSDTDTVEEFQEWLEEELRKRLLED